MSILMCFMGSLCSLAGLIAIWYDLQLAVSLGIAGLLCLLIVEVREMHAKK